MKKAISRAEIKDSSRLKLFVVRTGLRAGATPRERIRRKN